GYVLSRDYWGQGLMPEAVEAVIDYLFGTLGYDFVTCGHFEWNAQSRRVIEKCGFLPLNRRFDYVTVMGTHETSLLYVRYNPHTEHKPL
ncbi:MAG: GNAT family N-acetyltransferase, partial [Clostridia bacterium]|nr:GNAT family N-acetyltransferase [Clostridia bacterium]